MEAIKHEPGCAIMPTGIADHCDCGATEKRDQRRGRLTSLFEAMLNYQTVSVPDRLHGGRREGTITEIRASGTVFVTNQGKKAQSYEPGEVEVV